MYCVMVFEARSCHVGVMVIDLLYVKGWHLQDVSPLLMIFASAMVVRGNCLHCAAPCQSQYVAQFEQEQTLVFLPQWRDWAIKLLVRQVCRSRWTAYGEALKRIKAGKVCTMTLCVSVLNLNYDV